MGFLRGRRHSDQRHVASLMEDFGHWDTNVRRSAALHVAEFGESAVPQLVAALSGDDALVTDTAGYALQRIGAPAVPAVCDLLMRRVAEAESLPDPSRRDDYVNRVAGVLTEIADARVVDAITATLQFAIRYRADVTGYNTLTALRRLPREAVPNDIDDLVFKATRKLGQEAGDVAFRWIADVGSDETVARLVSLLPLRVGDEACRKALLSRPDAVRPELLKALSDPDEWVRSGAAYLLGDVGDASAVDPLLERLADESRAARQSAVQGLRGIGNRRAIEQLRQLAGTDPDESVRHVAEAAVRDLERGEE